MLIVALLLAAGTVPPAAPVAHSANAPGKVENTVLRRGDAYGWLIQARMSLQRGRSLDVVRAVQEATTLLPADADLKAEGSALLLGAGRREAAEAMAREALAAKPRQATALRVLADLSANRAIANGDTAARDEAIALYDRLAAEPQADDGFQNMAARLKLQAGDAAGAVAMARRAATARPGDPISAGLLAEALAAEGKNGEAVEAIGAWIAQNPDEPFLMPRFQDLVRRTGEWERALPTLDAVLAATPDDREVLAFRGEARAKVGRYAEAIEDLEVAAKGPDAGAYAKFQLASAYVSVKRLAEAAELATALAAEGGDNPVPFLLAAEVAGMRGDDAGAAEAWGLALERYAARGPQAADRRDECRLRRAAALRAIERYDEAERTLAELEAPDTPDAIEARAQLALDRGDDAAAAPLAASLRAKGEAATAAAIEARSLARAKDVAGATARWREVIAAYGNRARAQAAFALREAGFAKEGEALLREWTLAAPEDAEARFRLGSFLEREGRFTAAESELREAIRLAPTDPEALNYLGYSLIDRNERVEEGLALVRRALAVDPHNGGFLDSLGWGLFRLGRAAEAREPMERAAAEFPFDATVLDHLGDVYRKLGEVGKARDAWKRALESRPDDPAPIRKKLDSVRVPGAH
ncbi:MAG TPA: tetratricopeptide repeat protein [Candidatus Polarisedimenticolaceae bacterium]